MKLGREDILKAEDRATEEVECPEWGGTVTVRGLTGKERDEFEASIMVRRGKRMVPDTGNIRAKLVMWCCLDADGAQMFSHADLEALGGKSAAPIDRVYEVAARLSGLSDEDVEELTQDFGKAAGAASSSPSSGTSAASRSKGSSPK